MKKYFPLFRIALLHNFYPAALGKGLVLTPAPATIPLMRRYDLLGRSDGHEYFVFYGREMGSTSTLNPPALAYVEKPFGLRFILGIEHPYFFNITALPFPKNALEKLHFHNLRPHIANGQSLSLANGPHAGVEDLLTRDIGLRASDLGAVDIFIGREPNNMIMPPTTDPGDPAPAEQQYHISFEARKTHWRYYVVNLPDPENTEVEVMADCKKIEKTSGAALSDKPPVCKIFGNQPADRPSDCKISETDAGRKPLDCKLFEKGDLHKISGVEQVAMPLFSKHAFPMQEQPLLKIKLRISKKNDPGSGSNGASTTVDLPTPDWRRISQGPDEKVFSDMYVYL
jgi:hypothetical protein